MERVLLVDDERDALEVLEWTLTDCGCEVRAVTEALDALELARSFKADLLVTDYYLGSDLNGLDVIRILRERQPELRTVLMTGMRVEDLQSEINAIGGIDVVRKPFDCAQIVRLLPSSKREQSADVQSSDSHDPPHE
jgi:DNA-binding NtrC family response regulator